MNGFFYLQCLLYITKAGCKACLINVYFVVLLSRCSKTNITGTSEGLLASFDARLDGRFHLKRKASTPACRLNYDKYHTHYLNCATRISS